MTPLRLSTRGMSGALGRAHVFRADEPSFLWQRSDGPGRFDAEGAAFKLAAEALRIKLAHLFDPMMAVHTSNVEPLPHQISAVYESMLPRQPLRFVLADDPGAGKTIMAGLLIRELIMRADARRILIVAPGSLVDQWQDELREKFGLEFDIFSREHQDESSASGNSFDEQDQLIVRLDQLVAQRGMLQEKLVPTPLGPGHLRRGAQARGQLLRRRGQEDRALRAGRSCSADCTRHFLLMTATPHNGKEEDFQLFLSLLDADRFYGKFREGGTRRRHRPDAPHGQGGAAQVRRHAAVPRAACLHRQLRASPRRGGPLRSTSPITCATR